MPNKLQAEPIRPRTMSDPVESGSQARHPISLGANEDNLKVELQRKGSPRGTVRVHVSACSGCLGEPGA
jgi:hypothetical protein